MGAYLKNLLLSLLIFFFSSTIFTGIVMPDITLYYLATLLILSTGVMMTEPFLKFLTIKVNFLTYWLMSSILLTGITFLLRIFMTGFFVEISEFSGASFDFLEVNGFEIAPIFTIILFSVLSALISSIFYSLEKSN
jgi:hypothetical protein